MFCPRVLCASVTSACWSIYLSEQTLIAKDVPMKEIRLGFPERHLSLFRDAVLLDAGQFCANIDRASDKRSAQFGVELTSVLSFAVFVVAMSSLNEVAFRVPQFGWPDFPSLCD